MSTENSKSMADLDFLVVSEYLRYVQLNAGLVEIQGSAIFSFVIAKGGLPALRKKKTLLLGKLVENNTKLAEWVATSGLAAGSKELVMARSMYLMNAEYIKIINEHLRVCGALEIIKGANPGSMRLGGEKSALSN